MIASPGLRAAVIGLGRMGMHHVRACHDTTGVELVAILDHKPDWAVQVGAETQSLVAADVESLFGKVDIAIIAVPTRDHANTAIPLLRHGISCLVEKPIAESEADAEAMISAAHEGKAVLQIGHIERFNPVIEALLEGVGAQTAIHRIEARRHNPPQDRPYDVDAVLDLMIHDLDLLMDLTENTIRDIAVQNNANTHAVSAHFRCGTTTEVVLSVDRKAETPERSLTIETKDGTFIADLTSQQLMHRTSSEEKEISVPKADALRRQLTAFVTAADSGKLSGASGQDGLAALRLANRVRAAADLLQ